MIREKKEKISRQSEADDLFQTRRYKKCNRSFTDLHDNVADDYFYNGVCTLKIFLYS
jgi:hypothetical protein